MPATGNDPAWRPDEPQAADVLRDEELFFEGSIIATIACGAVAILGIECVFMLARKLRKFTWQNVLLLVYVVLVCSLSIIYAGATIQLAQQTFVDDRNYPGGPAAYQIESSDRLSFLGDVCIVVSAMLSDALLVRVFICQAQPSLTTLLQLWRCIIIYQSTSISSWIVYGLAAAFWFVEFSQYQNYEPHECVLTLSRIVLGTLLLVQLQHIYIFSSVDFITSLWCFSLGLNVLATLLICARLAYYRYMLRHSFGRDSEAAAPYTSIIAMIIESEALYTAYLIMFIVPLVRDNVLVYAFIQSPAAIQVGSYHDPSFNIKLTSTHSL